MICLLYEVLTSVAELSKGVGGRSVRIFLSVLVFCFDRRSRGIATRAKHLITCTLDLGSLNVSGLEWEGMSRQIASFQAVLVGCSSL